MQILNCETPVLTSITLKATLSLLFRLLLSIQTITIHHSDMPPLTTEGALKWISSKFPSNMVLKVGSKKHMIGFKVRNNELIHIYALWASSFYSPLVVRITGLFVVLMNVLMAARNPESSSKITSTSSNRMSEVAVFLFCSSLLFSFTVAAVGDLTAGSLCLLTASFDFVIFLESAVQKEIKAEN